MSEPRLVKPGRLCPSERPNAASGSSRPTLCIAGVPADFAAPAGAGVSMTGEATHVFLDFSRSHPATQRHCATVTDMQRLFYMATPATVIGPPTPMVFTIAGGVFRAWQEDPCDAYRVTRLDLTVPASQLANWLVAGIRDIDMGADVTVQGLVQCLKGTMDKQPSHETLWLLDKLSM